VSVLLPALAFACSASHGVRPVGAGNMALQASAGGPLVEIYGKPVPLPLSTVGLRYGLTDRADLHAAVHPSLLGLVRLGGIEGGLSYQLVAPGRLRPALVVDGTISVIAGDAELGEADGGTGVFGDLAVLASWAWSAREHLVYTGAHLFAQPRPLSLHLAPLVGMRWRLTPGLAAVTEARWIDPWQATDDWTLHWYGPRNQGAIQALVGLYWTPQRLRRGPPP